MAEREFDAPGFDLDAALEEAEQGAAGRLIRSAGGAIRPRHGLSRQIEGQIRAKSVVGAAASPAPGIVRRFELAWVKQMLWKTRSVSLTAILVTMLTAALLTVGADASPFRDNPNNRPAVKQTTTTGTSTTGTSTTTSGTSTTTSGTSTTTSGTSTTTSGTSTTTSGTATSTTTGTTTATTTSATSTTTTGTTTGATTTGTATGTTTSASPGGALPAQSNACDQKHPDTGNDTDGGQPGTPGHNNPKCATTTTVSTSVSPLAPVVPMPSTRPGNGNGGGNGGNGNGGSGAGDGGNGGQGNGNGGAGNGNGNGNGGGKKK